MKCRHGFVLSVAIIGLSIGVNAESQGQEVKAPRKNRLIEEVIVTAQKREQAIQDVPIAISAYSAEKLDAMGVESVQDLEVVSPGLTITTSAGFGIAYLRGIGTEAFLPGADTSVPFYLDGVALLSTQGSADTLGRVERVEVLKGPQGTLFGRNATGGAISIVTPNPSVDEFYGDISFGVAEYDEQNITAFANVPVTDKLAFTVSGYDNSRDNYYTSINPNGDPVLDIFSEGYRFKGVWYASEDIDINLSYAHNKAASNAGLTLENTRPYPVIGGIAVLPADPKADRKINTTDQNGAIIESDLLSGSIEWRMPWFDTKVIVSDQELSANFTQVDYDGTNLPIATFRSIKQISEQQTAELQILSNENSPFADKLTWVAGLYFLESEGGFDPLAITVGNGGLPAFLPAVIPPGFQLPTLSALLPFINGLPVVGDIVSSIPDITLYTGGILVSDSKSVYAQGSYMFNQEWELTLGARYQEEERDLIKARLSLDNGSGSEGLPLRQDEVPALNAEQFSPKVALSWRPFENDYNQIYASYSRAFKSPTYNTVNLLDTPEKVDEEIVDSFGGRSKLCVSLTDSIS